MEVNLICCTSGNNCSISGHMFLFRFFFSSFSHLKWNSVWKDLTLSTWSTHSTSLTLKRSNIFIIFTETTFKKKQCMLIGFTRYFLFFHDCVWNVFWCVSVKNKTCLLRLYVKELNFTTGVLFCVLLHFFFCEEIKNKTLGSLTKKENRKI